MKKDKIFVGLETALQQLEKLFEESGKGIGSFVAVTGEAGVGKSALLEKFSAYARENGAQICEVSIQHREANASLAPFQEILQQFQPAPIPADLRPTAAAQPASGSEISPEWGNDDFERLQSGFKLSQQKLLISILRAIGRQHVVIILKNIQHAQPSDWQFLHYFCENIGDHRIMLVISTDLNDSKSGTPQDAIGRDVLQRMNRERLVQFIELQRFGKAEIRKFLFHYFGKTDFSNQFIPLLHAATQGLPKRLEKCLQLLVEKGIVYEKSGIWYNAGTLSRDVVQAVISPEQEIQRATAQLSQLSERSIDLLRCAALMDRPFDHQLLAPVLNRPRIKVLQMLNALCEQNIFVQSDTEKYDFAEPVLRIAAERLNSEKEKQRRHAAIATAVREAEHLKKEQRASLLAWHCLGAGKNEEALQALLDSANCALLNFGIAEARFAYERAEKLAGENFSELPAATAIQVLLKYAWLERLLGDRQSSLQRFQAAHVLCRRTGDQSHEVQVNIQLGLTHYFLNQLDESERCFNQCLQMQEALTGFDVAMAQFGLGHVAFERADYDAADGHLQAALVIAEKLDEKRLMANIYNILGALENVKGLSMRAIVHYSRSTPIFEAIGDHSGLARIYHNIGMTHADLEDWQKADEFYSKSLRISDMMGLVALKSITFLNRAMALAHLAKLDEAEEYNTKAHHLLQRINDELGLAEYSKIQGVIDLLKGDYTSAIKNLDQAIEDFSKHKNSLGIAESEHERAKVEEAAGNPAAALEWYQKALARFQELGVEIKARRIRQDMASLNTQDAEKDKHFEDGMNRL